MKKLTALATATLLLTGMGVAQARDLGPDEALKLRDSGKIKSFEVLNQAPSPSIRARPPTRPNWKKNTVATSINWNCVTPKV